MERFLPLAATSMGRTGWPTDTGVNYLTTSVWKAIASPGDQIAMPTLSSLLSDAKRNGSYNAFEAVRSLWNAILQVSVTSLGWPSPALGFLHWREAGYPVADPRFEMFARLLGDDLDTHTAEVLSFLFDKNLWGRNLTEAEEHVRDSVLTHARPAWLDRFATTKPDVSRPSLSWGGTDPLHMQVHVPIIGLSWLGIPADDVTDQTDTYIGDTHAMLMLGDYAAWYHKLDNFGASLPQRPDRRSWRVDVVVKPVGWLGTYRRSRLTGRWFSGPHSIHEWGALPV